MNICHLQSNEKIWLFSQKWSLKKNYHFHSMVDFWPLAVFQRSRLFLLLFKQCAFFWNAVDFKVLRFPCNRGYSPCQPSNIPFPLALVEIKRAQKINTCDAFLTRISHASRFEQFPNATISCPITVSNIDKNLLGKFFCKSWP